MIALWSLWTLFLAGVQTVMWPLLTGGGVPAPQLWLNMILYLVLFRPLTEAMLWSYGLALLLNPFTSLPLGFFWAYLFVLLPAAHLVKSHAFWPSARYFAMASLLMSFAWHVLVLISTRLIESRWTDPHLFLRFTEIILTPLVAYPQYFIMRWMDKLTAEETAPSFPGVHE